MLVHGDTVRIGIGMYLCVYAFAYAYVFECVTFQSGCHLAIPSRLCSDFLLLFSFNHSLARSFIHSFVRSSTYSSTVASPPISHHTRLFRLSISFSFYFCLFILSFPFYFVIQAWNETIHNIIPLYFPHYLSVFAIAKIYLVSFVSIKLMRGQETCRGWICGWAADWNVVDMKKGGRMGKKAER